MIYKCSCYKFKTSYSLWTIHNGVFGAPNVCNGVPIEKITCVTLYRIKRVLFVIISAISVIGKFHGYVTFIDLNFVLLSLLFIL